MGIESGRSGVPPTWVETEGEYFRVERPEYQLLNEGKPEVVTANWWDTAEWIEVAKPIELPNREEIASRILAVDGSDEAKTVLTHVASEIEKLAGTELDTKMLFKALFDSFIKATKDTPKETTWDLVLLIESTIEALTPDSIAAQEMINHFRALRVRSGALK